MSSLHRSFCAGKTRKYPMIDSQKPTRTTATRNAESQANSRMRGDLPARASAVSRSWLDVCSVRFPQETNIMYPAIGKQTTAISHRIHPTQKRVSQAVHEGPDENGGHECDKNGLGPHAGGSEGSVPLNGDAVASAQPDRHQRDDKNDDHPGSCQETPVVELDSLVQIRFGLICQYEPDQKSRRAASQTAS